MSNYAVSVRVNGYVAGYQRAMRDAETSTRGFVGATHREMGKLRDMFRSTQAQLAGVGLSIGFLQMQKHAASLDKTMTQIRLNANMTVKDQHEAYQMMFAMVKRDGGVIDDTVAGFNALIASGLKYKQAILTADAISKTRAVTGASDATLAGAVTVGAANFNMDLAGVGVATQMLDKMTVAGRLGNAELESLSDIFSRVAPRAQTAGMSFDKTLAFIEGLSQVERNPERLATLTDSTLRLFTNASYAKDAEKALGIKFFDGGNRRDPIAVLDDMRKKYQALQNDAQRFNFISGAFGNTDLDTQRGIQGLLSGKQIEDIRRFEQQIKNASGTVGRDHSTATDNAQTQAERLKSALRIAVEEGFSKPLNDAVSRAIQRLLDAPDKGGLGLSGGQLIGGAAVGAAGLYAASRFLPPLLRSVAGRFGGLGVGVGTGKALEAATGVTPVYVVNWSEMGGGSAGGMADVVAGAGAGAGAAKAVGWLAKLRGLAAASALVGTAPIATAGAGAIAGGVAAAGAVGYGLGSLINKYAINSTETGRVVGDKIGESVARVLALFGNQEAQQALAVNDAIKNSKVGGEVTVRLIAPPGMAVASDVKATPGTRLTANVGQSNQGAGW